MDAAQIWTLMEIAGGVFVGVTTILKVTARWNRTRNVKVEKLETSVAAIGSRITQLTAQITAAKVEVMEQVDTHIKRAEAEARESHRALSVQMEGNHRTLEQNYIGHRQFDATMNGVLGTLAELRNEIARLTSRVDDLFRSGRVDR